MTKIKLCGLTRPEDIALANQLKPDYIGFVFARKSKRYIDPEAAGRLKAALDPAIRAVGVFVNESPDQVAGLLETGVIDLAQLHGSEDEDYIRDLRNRTDKALIQAFRIHSREDIQRAEKSSADHLLLDAGAGMGESFDWKLIGAFTRPYFLAGGLDPGNVAEAVKDLAPYGVDVSSGIETGGVKDGARMEAFVKVVRSIDRKG